MCGRFTLTQISPDVLKRLFVLRDLPNLDIRPRYNIAPGQDIPAVRQTEGGDTRELSLLHWGLIPSWAEDSRIGYKMINARAESVAEKPAFRRAFKTRRCLVPADGFYEWQRDGKLKNPYLMKLKGGDPFAFAGLWDRWVSPDGEPIESCTIITTTPNELLAPIHDRMPVIIPPDHYAPWLDPSLQDAGTLQSLLVPYPAEKMSAQRIGTWVNSPSVDDARCVEPITAG